MALQQVSLGGASSPVAPVDLTSQSQTNTGGLNYQQYLSDIADTPLPIASAPTPGVNASSAAPQAFTPSPGNLTPPSSPNIKINPFTTPSGETDANLGAGQFLVGQTPQVNASGSLYNPGNPYEWDPFSFSGSGEGAPLSSEKQSPGYQAYGQNWLDLLNTVSTQDLKWGGTNDYGGELKGGGSVGPWLTQNIVTPYQSGNQNDALANAIYFISSQTGKPATDPEVQKLGGAFLDYTLQNSNRYAGNTQNFDTRKASEGGLFGGVLGDLIGPLSAIADIASGGTLIPFTAALNAGIDLSEGNYLGAGLAGLGGIGGGLSDLADINTGLSDTLGITNTTDEGLFNVANQGDMSLLQDLGTAGQVANIAGTAGGVGQALSQGNFLGALGPAIGLGSAAIGTMPSSSSNTGTTGSNASGSGGVLSGVANGLGLTPQQLIDYTGSGISLASSGLPLLEEATAGGSPTLNVSPPLPPPPAQAAAPAPTPSAPGQPLTAQAAPNSAQASYQQPGPRQANPQQLAALLAALGVPT